MPSIDFGDVAARIAAGTSGIRACLVVSRDGLSLGAYPADGEERARSVWDLLEQVGEVKRGFVDMGMELWVVSKRGPYAAVVVATPDVKPGLVLDRMDANLIAAEQARAREATGEPVAPPRPEPVRRPRSPLHPEPRLDHLEEPPEATTPEAEPAPVMADPPRAEAATEAEAPPDPAATPVVDLSRVPDPDPVPEPAAPEPEPIPEPAAADPVPEAVAPAPDPVPEAVAPAPDPVAEAPELAAPQPPAEPAAPPVERVPTFQPASTPIQTDDVYVAGVTPVPPVTEPSPAAAGASDDEPDQPADQAATKRQAKKAAKRRSRRSSGEVDRVALAREFGRLLQDEFGA